MLCLSRQCACQSIFQWLTQTLEVPAYWVEGSWGRQGLVVNLGVAVRAVTPSSLLCIEDFIHTCERLCHEGDCGPCSRTSVISCRCSFRTKELPCTSLKSEDATFMCDKRCNKKRLCGRHKCNEICCVDKEHKCPLICGRKLRCGLHRCEEPCHRGNCQTCWQASFDELTCHCGASVIYPPVPCGTRPPECTQTCARIHECDHPGESLQSPHLTACSHLDLGGAVQGAPARWLGSVLVS